MSELPSSPHPLAAAHPEWLEKALAQPGRSHYVEANGARLHFLSWGFEDRHKPTLLFVHGFRGHAHWWDFIAPWFTENYRVVAMDLSGMGDSSHRVQYDAGIPSGDIAAIAEHISQSPVIAIGHSYGGSRLLRACSERPELFQRLVIVDSYVVFEGESLPSEPIKVRGNHQYPDLASGAARFRLIPAQADAIPGLVEHVARHSLRRDAGGWRWKFDTSLPPGGAREADGGRMLARVTRPVDYLYGELSVVVNRQRAERIVQALPQACGPIEIPAGHHHLMFDQPLALISTLRALLATQP
ncbi:alpha/beta hydrolase [Pseudomonas aeruginosa]|uniref:alpha/beta fold hydrolase n=1 Tax=Pseudomonas aeruginosa TaxID=287 RepID=UPI00071C0D5D|nr:alpha/beta hydrolase [Pseudomonas aeruginosa]KSQ25018.1 alpha/beta hydrolase [Pseudomonas aeruginosa]MCO1687922.1 alpha/beta hydrolase [Pseudomonas aeruginosa]MCO1778576.1 alpha/beta hydrolase [Pseudomonas aeruginosa]MCO1790115.1 alpha/beta hydrolase [Pseudomonas aeruginosa]MCO1799245.1 alpha/beta hydrolase [Pseudomonas aeruginosa]